MEHSLFDHEFGRLNDPQRQAVCHRSGPVLVIAGAGSGKTRVATMRVAHLIREGAAPDTIIAVTFTNKAAREMRERVHRLIGSEVTVSTFHSLGATILRESIHLLGYPNGFAIYAEEESEKILKACLHDRGIQCKEADLATYKAALSKMKGLTMPLADGSTNSLFEAYQQRLKQSGAVDFDDLIYLPLELFRHHPEVLANYVQRWHHLLVDEYQDTSESQCQFAVALAGPSMNIFAVGDPDQSIYSWRGANVANILSFEHRFPNATVIRLEQNYRSTNTILEASNAVIGCNSRRFDKSLWSDRGRGDPIGRFVARTERHEAEFVTSTIASLIEGGETFDHIAILYRTNAQSRPLEDRCIDRRIPYRIWGGVPFYSRKEIKDVLSLLQIALLPQDSVAFERALKIVVKGIGEVTLDKLRHKALEEQRSIYETALDAANGAYDLTNKQRESLSAFCTVISSLRSQIEQGSAFDLLSSAMNDSGYNELLEKDPDTLLERRENLAQLLSRAQEWDEQHETASAMSFIEELMLEGAREQGKGDGPAVTLATIHNAKGLEFSIVFLVGLEEDLFPHINAKDGEEKIEEERRLFYVGMTRAKDKLFVSCSQNRFLFGGVRLMRMSRFLKEIPQEYIAQRSLSNFVAAAPLVSPVAQKPQPTTELYAVGQLVLHPQFGIGRVEGKTETSAGMAYEVIFSNDHTRRKILAHCSPMRPIGGD
jgi:DNA helicase-2/ATP-dependent DNA helicase PcrA